MARVTRIYTRGGDDGTTGLIGGSRVRKNALRIEAYGTIDELSSAIGLARTALAEVSAGGGPQRSHVVAAQLDRWLAWTQDVLFNVGSDLASPAAQKHDALPHVAASDVTSLEHAIDAAQDDLPPLNQFIHPGGDYPGAFLHLARTIARRAERLVVALSEREPISQDILRYLNRLSDALFVWARWINHAYGRSEHAWNHDARPPA